MGWASLVKALLILVVWLVKNKLDGKQRKEFADEIDKASVHWTDQYVDERLRPYYRDVAEDDDK